jgi:mannan endo-1,4-beta-mannosidase
MSGKVDRRQVIQATGAALAVTAAAAAIAGPIVARTLGADRTPPPVPVGDEARQVLAWLTELPKRADAKVLCGQQINGSTLDGYLRYLTALYTRTGKYPALAGVTFDNGWQDWVNLVLIQHWRAGGLVTMEMHPENPWDTFANSWVANAKSSKPDLRELLADAPDSPQKRHWRGIISKVGDALTQLSNAGVVVLFRPLHELNGSWFWWGQDIPSRKTHVAELYRDLHDYLTRDRGLSNLLWVYGPAPSWDGPIMQYYPGSQYVDIIAPSRYDDELLMFGDRPNEKKPSDYTDIKKAGKPVAFGECGPVETIDGSWDATTIIKRIRNNYPDMCYFLEWNGWDDTTLELAGLQNTEELMRDPWVISRDEVDWRRSPVTTTPTRPTTTSPSQLPGGPRPSNPPSNPPTI